MTDFGLAERRKTNLRLALEGPAGSGKTLSALLIAFGITGDWGTVGIADTEHERALAYVSREEKTWSVGRFRHQPVDPPYNVSKFLNIMKKAEQAGIEVLILDSISHAWMGEGGVLDYVDQVSAASQSKNSFNAWNKGSKAQNTLIEAIMASPMHIIATMRVKTAWDIVEDERGKKKPVKIGQAPVQRDSTDYEFDVIFTMANDGHFASVGKDTTGLYDGRIFVPSPEIGMQFLAWSDEGSDPAPQQVRSAATFDADDQPAAAATNGKPTVISAEQVANIEAIITEKGRTVSGVVASLNRHGVCPGELETIPIAAYEDVVNNLRDLKPVAQAAQEPQEAPAAPAVAEAPTAVQAATESSQQTEAQSADDLAGFDNEDKAFLQGCDDDNKAAQKANEPEKGSGTIASRQLQQLGIICSHLESAGIMWQPIATSVIKRAFESRKEFSFEEGQAVIKTLRSIEKTLPEEAKAS